MSDASSCYGQGEDAAVHSRLKEVPPDEEYEFDWLEPNNTARAMAVLEADQRLAVSFCHWKAPATRNRNTTIANSDIHCWALQEARKKLVPSKITENKFWRNYFYKCDMVVNSYLKMTNEKKQQNKSLVMLHVLLYSWHFQVLASKRSSMTRHRYCPTSILVLSIVTAYLREGDIEQGISTNARLVPCSAQSRLRLFLCFPYKDQAPMSLVSKGLPFKLHVQQVRVDNLKHSLATWSERRVDAPNRAPRSPLHSCHASLK